MRNLVLLQVSVLSNGVQMCGLHEKKKSEHDLLGYLVNDNTKWNQHVYSLNHIIGPK